MVNSYCSENRHLFSGCSTVGPPVLLGSLKNRLSQRSRSVCKAFSQRCQEEERLFGADGRLTGF